MKTDPSTLDWGDGGMWDPTSRAWPFGLVKGAFEAAARATLEAAFAFREAENLFRPLADGLARMQSLPCNVYFHPKGDWL